MQTKPAPTEPLATYPAPAAAALDEACVTCGASLTTPFCAACGERRATDRAYSLREFAHDALEQFLSFDGRAIRTLITLLRRPGELTAAYMRGVRLPYLSPLHCFLVANLIYFVWATLAGDHTFGTRLYTHVHSLPYSADAMRDVTERLARTHEDPKALERTFDAVGSAQAKTLVLVMVPVFALIVGLVTMGRRRFYAVQHLSFALHAYAFLFCVAIIAAYVVGFPSMYLPKWLGMKVGDRYWDLSMTTAIVTSLGIYLRQALRRAYEFGPIRASVTALLLLAAMAMILQEYRHLQFIVTFRSV
jgi:hypothetical protein